MKPLYTPLGFEDDIAIIHQLESKQTGNVLFENSQSKAVLEKSDGSFILSIDLFLANDLGGFDMEEQTFLFSGHEATIDIRAVITGHRRAFELDRSKAELYSEGEVYGFCSVNFEKNSKKFFRAYYPNRRKKIICDLFDTYDAVLFTIKGSEFLLKSFEGYIIIESTFEIVENEFSEACYNIMIAVGFLSGHFIQSEVYIFQRSKSEDVITTGYMYKMLRKSSYSIYHAITHNPYGYKHMIGEDFAKELYTNKLLKPMDVKSFSGIIEMINYNSQIQYALVLFNEANDNNASLLVKNNCFYVVLEILRKFFHEKFKNQIPKGFTSKSNTEKYRVVFEQLISLDESEIDILVKRNNFLHGDILQITDQEMVSIMQKQITLIYRLVLCFVGFKGYVIDHYKIRSGSFEEAFVKSANSL